MKSERRFIAAAEFRMAGEDSPRIEGYAAVFNSLSEDLGGFREIIRPGAFAQSLGADVRALWNHDANHVLGRTRANTLTLSEDAKGLRVEIHPPESAAGMLESMTRGDVDQMSFGFVTRKDDWAVADDGTVVRTLIEVDLFDVSVVTFPAYPETEAALRGLERFREEIAPPAPAADFSLARARLRLAGA